MEDAPVFLEPLMAVCLNKTFSVSVYLVLIFKRQSRKTAESSDPSRRVGLDVRT